MTTQEFNRRLKALGNDGDTLRNRAAYLVLVEGSGLNEACRAIGVTHPSVSTWVTTIRKMVLCSQCGSIDKR